MFLQEKEEEQLVRAMQQRQLREKGGKRRHRVKKHTEKNKDKENKDKENKDPKGQEKPKTESMQLIPKSQQPRFRALLVRIFHQATASYS